MAGYGLLSEAQANEKARLARAREARNPHEYFQQPIQQPVANTNAEVDDGDDIQDDSVQYYEEDADADNVNDESTMDDSDSEYYDDS